MMKSFFAVEQQAEFPGGMAAMMKFIQKNLKYPAYARRMGVEGNVFVIFLVEKDGSISNVKIQRGINADLDEGGNSYCKHVSKVETRDAKRQTC
jgi:protein TonB